MSLVFIGTVALDSLETPYGRADHVAGGSALYGSLSASYFTNPVKLVGVIGGDFPQKDREMLDEHDIVTEGLQVKSDQKSFYWAGRYHQDMNSRDTLVTELNVLADFDPLVPESYQDCEFLMLGNLTPDIQLQVIERIRRRPTLIVLDTMNFWMDSALDSLKTVLQKIDILTINEEESRQLSGEYSLAKAAKKILTMGPEFLIIKKGEHGALLFSKDQVFFAPGLPLEEVIDPTGAGDSFAGGFIGYLAGAQDLHFETLKKAIIHGSAMASFCVEQFGTLGLQALNTQQIQARVHEFVLLSTFVV